VIESLDLAPFAAMELSGDWDGVAEVTLEAAKRLEAGGAQGVIITSNTGHKVYDAVAPKLGVPMLHIGDATADALVADGRKQVALLGTRFTMLEPHVRSRIERRGITLVEIDRQWIDEVDRIIFEELAAGRVVRDSQRKLKTLITELAKQRVHAVVLGCTELVLAVDVVANVLPFTIPQPSMPAPRSSGYSPGKSRRGPAPDSVGCRRRAIGVQTNSISSIAPVRTVRRCGLEIISEQSRDSTITRRTCG
jgi:aspartate racemase